MKATIGVIFLALLLITSPRDSWAQTLYIIHDLGSNFRASAISNNKIIVGSVFNRDTRKVSPAKWQNGRTYKLPFPDSTDPYYQFESGWAVNVDDTGEHIIGECYYWDEYAVIYWDSVNAYFLRVGRAKGINRLGHMIGEECSSPGCASFIYVDGSIKWFSEIGDYDDSEVEAINNLNQVVGYIDSWEFSDLKLWESDELYSLSDLVSSPVPYRSTFGRDINDLYQFVGCYNDEDGDRASFLYEGGKIKPIGKFQAEAINETSQVVGDNYLYDYQSEHLIDINGFLNDDQGWLIIKALDINDAGDIIGEGRLFGSQRFFMLVPCEANTYFFDQDGDGYGDPHELTLACTPPNDYVLADGVNEFVVNGGMEGDSNWHDWEDPVANERSGTHVYRDNYARYFSADSAYDGIRSEQFRLRSGQTYRATLRVSGDGRAPLRALVAMNSRNSFHYKPNDQFPVPPQNWTRYSWTFTPRTTGNYAFYIEQAPQGPTGSFYIDDVSLTNVDSSISDCNDQDANVHPGARESCNNRDDDCDGDIDEGVATTYYRDEDGDGFGNPSRSRQDCAAPNGYTIVARDCDDTNAEINPNAVETCNGIDDDCDGTVDEGVMTTFFRDADIDGYGDASNTIQACSSPNGYVTSAGDCDDTRGTVYPGASESCNSRDDNCDGAVDEGVQTTFYRDVDGDGYGDLLNTTTACSSPAGYLLTAGDCDDTRTHIYPDAVEGCNGLDDDCDGEIDENCIENELPEADAGHDQTAAEGTTVSLDGSGSSDPDDGINTWKWIQVDGPSVVLSDIEISAPTFVAPPVADNGARLTFRLLVTDRKGAIDTAEVDVIIVDNGIQGLPDDAITIITGDQNAIGLKIVDGGSLVAISVSTNTGASVHRAFPSELAYGPYALTVRTTNIGDDARLACYFLDALPETHAVSSHSTGNNWIDTTEQAFFNTNRTAFETQLINGANTDEDGADNHFIVSTIAIGRSSSRVTPGDPNTGGSSGSSGGSFCFIGVIK